MTNVLSRAQSPYLITWVELSIVISGWALPHQLNDVILEWALKNNAIGFLIRISSEKIHESMIGNFLIILLLVCFLRQKYSSNLHCRSKTLSAKVKNMSHVKFKWKSNKKSYHKPRLDSFDQLSIWSWLLL